MQIKEFKKREIETISLMDLRIVLNSSFNKKIVNNIEKELIRRDNLLK